MVESSRRARRSKLVASILVDSGVWRPHDRIAPKKRKRSLGEVFVSRAHLRQDHLAKLRTHAMETEAKHSLRDRWEALLKAHPKLRIRDAARRLGVGEAQLLTTDCGHRVVRLEGNWTELIRQFPRLGRVMCLTRNEHAVHERYGEFRQIDFFNGMGRVVGPDIDLRLFMQGWRWGFAVTDLTPQGERQSFQFFDAAGDAIHKVYLNRASNLETFGELLDRFRSPNQHPWQDVEARAGTKSELPDSEIDILGFQQAWRELKDTHAFFNILKKFQVAREQALRLAPEGYPKK